jgi:hypothetical protein
MTKTKDLLSNHLSELTAILNDFCDSNHLPQESADELYLRDDLTDAQSRWLKHFCETWESVQDFYVFVARTQGSPPT